MAWTLKDIPTFYIFDGKKVDYTENERKALLKEWKEDDTRIENEKINHLRKQRDTLLTKSDWVVIKEREEGGTVKNFADWKKYRQELRDITNTYKSLDKVKWPTAPSE